MFLLIRPYHSSTCWSAQHKLFGTSCEWLFLKSDIPCPVFVPLYQYIGTSELLFHVQVFKVLLFLPWWWQPRTCLQMQEAKWDVGSVPHLGRSPRGGHGNPFQCTFRENHMDRGAWLAAVYRFTKIRHDWSNLALIMFNYDYYNGMILRI